MGNIEGASSTDKTITKIDVEQSTSGKWMNEANIVTSSYPYLNIVLGTTTKYSIPHNQLKEVEIEGKTSMSRKGSVKFVDAIGEWPDILMKIGSDSNRVINVRKPNISLEFGWRKLRGNYECLRKLDGMVIRSAIDLTEDGQVMISLEYIETVTSVTGTIRYLNPDDIEIIYKKKEDGSPKFSEMTVAEKLRWLTAWSDSPDTPSGTTVSKQLKSSLIKYSFEETNDDKESDINIGFGDYLVDVINELTSKAKKTPVKGMNYSYERGICYYEKSGDEKITVIPYRWKPAPDDSNNNPQSVFESANMSVGPVLAYKKSASGGEKQILSFSSDLNSKTSLMMQSQDEFSKKLMQFSEEDMELINESFRKKGLEGLDEKDKSGWFGSETQEDQRRNKIRTDMQSVVRSVNHETSTNQNDQLKAILANNVFKGNVKIMGDPTFGTDIEPWKITMQTNFSTVGGFGKTFGNRKWALTNVKHVFGEGSYETELELLTYPQPDDDPAKPDPAPDPSETYK